MARTKQTARKSTGGKAPRKQLALSSARQFRHFMTTQQEAGFGDDRTSFVNHENTLGSFCFYAQDPGFEDFKPIVAAASCVNPLTGIEEEWVGISYASKYDGQGIFKHPQPPLNVMVVLDISGSMAMALQGDVDDASHSQAGNGSRSVSSTSVWGAPSSSQKLTAGKKCIESLLKQLKSEDHVGVAVFNHDYTPIQGVAKCTPKVVESCMRRVNQLHANGGTALTQALEQGCASLCDSEGSKREGVVNRVVFITDMQSTISDELALMEVAKKYADGKAAVGLSVIGLGVDLSVATVRRLSSIVGCRYGSANSSQEMENVIANNFPYDRVPIATDIKFSVSPPFRIHRALGSAEAASVVKGAKSLTLSCEFATPLEEDGGAFGNMLLIQLDRESKAVGAEISQIEVKGQWQGGFPGGSGGSFSVNRALKRGGSSTDKGKTRATADERRQMSEGGSGFFESLSVRKAIALARYVDAQASYAVKEDVGGGSQVHQDNVERFKKLREHLIDELVECGDDSINGVNHNVLETIEQIIELEEKEIVTALQQEAAFSNSSSRNNNNNNNVPQNSVICPITMEIMKDPVCTADGHTYERDAIVRWLAEKGTSPVTGLPLPHNSLVPNHALRAMADAARNNNNNSNNSTRTRTDAAQSTGQASSFPMPALPPSSTGPPPSPGPSFFAARSLFSPGPGPASSGNRAPRASGARRRQTSRSGLSGRGAPTQRVSGQGLTGVPASSRVVRSTPAGGKGGKGGKGGSKAVVKKEEEAQRKTRSGKRRGEGEGGREGEGSVANRLRKRVKSEGS